MNKKSPWFPAYNQIGPFCQPTCEYAEGIFLTFLLTLLSAKENMWTGCVEKTEHIYKKTTLYSYQNSDSTKALIIGKPGIKHPKFVVSGKLAGCFVVEYPQNKFFPRRIVNFHSNKVDKGIINDKIDGHVGAFDEVNRGFNLNTKKKLKEIINQDNWIFELFIFCIQEVYTLDEKSIKNIYNNFNEYYDNK